MTDIAESVAAGQLPAGEETVEQQVRAARAARSAERKGRKGVYVVIFCIVLLLLFTMLGSMLNVGDHLMTAHPVLGWVFYGLIVVLVIVGIIVPIVKVAKRPVFSLYQLRDESGNAKRGKCRMLVDNLAASGELTDEEVAQLQGYLKSGDHMDDLLIEFFHERLVPVMDAETRRSAATAFLIAAVSRSPLVSTVTMLSLCFDLVRAIVEVCGFRPTNLALVRLYTRVMISALIIGGIEDSDLSDLITQVLGGGAGARAGGLLLGATAEGLVSAFLVFRVGVLTRRWLTAEDGPARMGELRRTSYREALSMMRSGDFVETVTDALKKVGGNVASSVGSKIADAAKSTADAAKSVFTKDFWY